MVFKTVNSFTIFHFEFYVLQSYCSKMPICKLLQMFQEVIQFSLLVSPEGSLQRLANVSEVTGNPLANWLQGIRRFFDSVVSFILDIPVQCV
jgi:hypothetical protein